MESFVKHEGLVALLDNANVDTDQIIPKQFLKSIKRTGFGDALFFDWRYLDDGRDNPDFALNAPRYQGASILVARNNFGCGSSREHAVWAVMQYGFKVVIAPRVERGPDVIPAFADIFRNNALRNGLLTVELPEEDVDFLFEHVGAVEGCRATVDLESQLVTLHAPTEKVLPFEIDASTKNNLMQGLDHIAQTLEHSADIDVFEKQHDTLLPL